MDINGDGFNDVFSGCYSQKGHASMVGSYWVMYGDKQGNFAKPVELMGTDGKLLQVHDDLDGNGDSRLTENICTRPFAVDWNGDGKLDIVAGNFKGTFFVFSGEGEGKFKPDATELKDIDGKALKISGVHSDPNIVDWDGDGDLDLVTGSSDGNVFWAENVRERDEKVTGADRTPQLTALKSLIKAPKEGPKSSLRIHVADINGDGRPDILAGDTFRSGGGMRTDLSDADKAAYEQAQSDYDKALVDYRAIFAKYNAEYEKVLKDRGEITKEEQRALYKEMVTDKALKDEAMEGVRTAMNDARKKMGEYQVPNVSGGSIWVYEQK
ncbi:MAG: VCBS repeat-containing protein [Planctomycetes bacterium]|nr:VCBS repeat-containing protein [Planctomycetota bacterium]